MDYGDGGGPVGIDGLGGQKEAVGAQVLGGVGASCVVSVVVPLLKPCTTNHIGVLGSPISDDSRSVGLSSCHPPFEPGDKSKAKSQGSPADCDVNARPDDVLVFTEPARMVTERETPKPSFNITCPVKDP